MIRPPRFLRVRPRALFVFAIVFAIFIWSLLGSRRGVRPIADEELRRRFPLVWTHVHTSRATGGGKSPKLPLDGPSLHIFKYVHIYISRYSCTLHLTSFLAWYIPPEWIGEGHSQPKNIIEAVQLASNVTKSHPQRHIPFSNIPLFVHQTWKTVRLNSVNAKVLTYIEKWLTYSVSPPSGASPMAYFFWDDKSILSLTGEFEEDFIEGFESIFSPVEKSDIFRILVCKWFGGIVRARSSFLLHL